MSGLGPSGPVACRLLPATKLVAGAVVPVLLAAFVLLFGFPGRTEQLWAWTIRPDLAALIMGGAYLAGSWFFVRALRDGCWQRVSIGWFGLVPFVSFLEVATIMHWDRFNHGHVSFWAWLALYTVTPVALPLVWWANERATTAAAEPVTFQVPGVIRRIVATYGAVLLVVALILFVRPSSLSPHWPWELTPLTARTLASFTTYLAVVWLGFGLTSSWYRLSLAFEATTVGLATVTVAVVRGYHDLSGGPRTVLFLTVLGATVAASTALLLWANGQSRPAAA